MNDRYLILWKDNEKDNFKTNDNFDKIHKFIDSLVNQGIEHICLFDNYNVLQTILLKSFQ